MTLENRNSGNTMASDRDHNTTVATTHNIDSRAWTNTNSNTNAHADRNKAMTITMTVTLAITAAITLVACKTIETKIISTVTAVNIPVTMRLNRT